VNKTYGEKSIVISYVQQLLSETYNSKVNVTGEYYKHFDMNYGLAHFIAKYLDYKYPLLDAQSIDDYKNIDDKSVRSITKPISIANYFLCNNTGGKLKYNPYKELTDTENLEYANIYNKFMILVNKGTDGETDIEPENNRYFIKTDMPLFSKYNKDTNTYSVDNNTIFKLTHWSKKKQICELDDFVTSFLIGRTITPTSSMEDIYYVQRLLIRDREITREEKGVWCLPNAEGTEFDLTQTIINYQSERVNELSTNPIFVTGYFDIYTEACARKEMGDVENGICGI
jgi:hypothetical protein